ncbi:MAG: alpha-L-arabinofuranosidase C-terminal domain-containing protein, partial [Candidatus Jordarchaeaceae archaeon]
MLRASISVFPVKVLGEIDPHIYGYSIEHVGNCIYGGVWDTEKNSFNEEVIKCIRNLRPSVIKWPGGCFSDNYHWMDGIGPVEKRPLRENMSWSVLEQGFRSNESNRFGTDEFITFCRMVEADPYINLNICSGSPQEAANWVEYCNGNASHEFGSLRAMYGNPTPFKVKYWGVGGGLYGPWGISHMSADEYAEKFMAYCDAIMEVDQKVELVAMGADQRCPGWNKTVLEKAGKHIDYLSIPLYFPGFLFGEGGSEIREDLKTYRRIIASSYKFQEIIEWVRGTIESVMGGDHKVKIALNIWNLCWDLSQLVHVNYSVRDGLWVASVINKIHKLSSIVKMANFAQLVNALGIIQTDGKKVLKTVPYEVMKLYREHTQKYAISAEVYAPKFIFEPLGILKETREIPYVDCSATRSPDGKLLTLFL